MPLPRGSQITRNVARVHGERWAWRTQRLLVQLVSDGRRSTVNRVWRKTSPIERSTLDFAITGTLLGRCVVTCIILTLTSGDQSVQVQMFEKSAANPHNDRSPMGA